MRYILCIWCCFFSTVVLSQSSKINGVSFVASGQAVDADQVAKLKNINTNYAAVMPFGFIRNPAHPVLYFNTDRQWFGERVDGVSQYIDALHAQEIEVMLKPQIWISKGVFTGKLRMETDADWELLELHYTEFITTFAHVATEKNVAVFCIGTELEAFVKARPQFWFRLIKKVRDIYKGKITYAANWDEYTSTPFWSVLDYIGVDAYFPLSDAKHPDVEELQAGWSSWKIALETISKKANTPILFTEFGYRSMNYTAKKPWLVDRHQDGVNLAAQATALQVQLETFWCEDWFAGGFVWKWFLEHQRAGGKNDNRFTPQNKPAEQVLKRWYTNF